MLNACFKSQQLIQVFGNMYIMYMVNGKTDDKHFPPQIFIYIYIYISYFIVSTTNICDELGSVVFEYQLGTFFNAHSLIVFELLLLTQFETIKKGQGSLYCLI